MPQTLPTGAGARFRSDATPESLDRRVLGLAGVGAGGLMLAAVNQLSGGRIGLPCPFHALTGLDCPICGTTRMAAAALRGDLPAAWGFNAPMLLIGSLTGVAVGYQLLAWTLERLRVVKLPRLRMSPRAVDLTVTVVLAGMLAFGVLRNL